MQKVYQRINWEDEPSKNTPINDDNLNKIDYALDQIDTRVVNLNGYQDRVAQSEANARTYANNAKTSENNAKTSADNAKQSENKAKEYMENAFNTTPDGYDKIVDTVNTMDIQTSEDSTLYNSKNGGYRLLEMVGNTEQKTLSGKNLLDLSEGGKVPTNSDGSITITTTSSITKLFVFTGVLPNGTYTFTNISGLSVYIQKSGSDYSNLIAVGKNFTFDYDGVSYLRLLYVDQAANSTVTYKAQLELSSVATSYEPYCGGAASPNPDYPQSINNTFDVVEMIQGAYSATSGDYQNSSVAVCPKHHIPCKAGDVIKLKTHKGVKCNHYYFFYSGNNYVTYLASIDTLESEKTVPSGVDSFTFHISNSNGLTPQTVGKITLKVNGKYVGQIVEHGKNKFGGVHGESNKYSLFIPANTPFVVSTKKGDTTSWFYVYDSNGTRIDYWNVQNSITLNGENRSYRAFNLGYDVSYVAFGNYNNGDEQIEFNDVATPYEPYTEKIATFFLNEPLRATDRVVKVDRVHMENHKRATVVLNGGFGTHATVSNLFYIDFNVNSIYANNKERGFAVCTHGKQRTYETAGNTEHGEFVLGKQSDTIARFMIKDTTCTTADEFNAKVQANPITVEYELAEETYTPLDTDSQLALNDMETFDGVTYIEVDSKVKPSSIKGKYGTSEVGALTLKNANDNDTDRIERAELKARLDELAVALVSQ